MLIEDFVNREKPLNTLWQIIQQKADERIVLISGKSGMGKTYLLEECCARCLEKGVLHARIDFAERWNHDYLSIIRKMRQQIGGEPFRLVEQAFSEVRLRFSHYEASPALPDLSGRTSQYPMSPPNPGRSGGVNFSGPAEIHGDVAGRDINFIYMQEDTFVQKESREYITMALQRCFQECVAIAPIVFFFDAWEKATQDNQNWLRQNLLTWIFEKRLPHVAAVIAGNPPPQFPRVSRRVEQVLLDGLSDEAVKIYWLQKRRLPYGELPNIIRLTAGDPFLIALLAEKQRSPR